MTGLCGVYRRAMPFVVSLSMAMGCATNAAPRHPGGPPAADGAGSGPRVFVMLPVVAGSAAPGNVGRDFAAITTDLRARIVSAASERVALAVSAPDATHLLVPTILEWTQMRTDDPLGALIGPHSGVRIMLRLTRVQPPAVVSEVTFHHRSRVTVNRDARGLLGNGFRRAVLELLDSLGSKV